MEQQQISNQTSKGQDNNRTLWKGIIILGSILFLLIPIAFIQGLVKERSDRQVEVEKELSKKWANPQTISGPVLMIPYYTTTVNQDKKNVVSKNWAYFLPDDLTINGEVQPEIRKRTLYKVNLMKANLNIKGTFKPLHLDAIQLSADKMLWNEARLIVGMSDIKSITKDVSLRWNQQNAIMASGSLSNAVASYGLSVPVQINAQNEVSFDLQLAFKSSKYIYFKAWGNNTTINLNSTWTSPSFEGMPDTVSQSKKGFDAKWKLVQAARPYPQQWRNGDVSTDALGAGIQFANASETYVMTERIVKYAILFIGLTFAVFFFIEMLQKLQIHPLQYGLVGIALCVFYVLVLSISEYAGFTVAYWIATAATILLLGIYMASVFKKSSITIAFVVGLTILYAYIFFLIQLEDMSLIFGSVALFVVLAAIMIFTRKVNWYSLGKSE